jgi:hypothetical protein
MNERSGCMHTIIYIHNLHDLFNNSNDIGPIQQRRILLKIKQHAFLIISMYINNRMKRG